ncbi:MAG: sigma 54-interacting transcriptional regulator [Pseudomonadota bacterium]
MTQTVDTGAPSYDSISDLLESMRFAPSSSGVWFESERMVMLHAAAFGQLREALIDAAGMEVARDRFMQIGYARGVDDVGIVSRISARGMEADRIFRAGPQLMSIMGITGAAPTFDYAFDEQTNAMMLRASSDVSLESEIHLKRFGVGNEPVCWFLNGYATGFCTAALGEPFLVKETTCRAAGHQVCKSIGRPLSAWPKEAVEAEASVYFGGAMSSADFTSSAKLRIRHKPKNAIAIASPENVTEDELSTRVVGQSASFQVAIELIRRVAPTGATALFLGETGVGKEVLARELHRLSSRADKPLIAVNCAALPNELVEAELFGVERGSYTGANKTRLGRFERANGGTLFLDEIGTLSLSAQAKVLRAIQRGELERVGDQTTRHVDIRLIAATNDDLVESVKSGAFRQDLYYRLNVFPITVPPLRDRRGDIRLLVDLFVQRFALKYGRTISGISVEAMDLIWSYDWPGNVRELENVIERGVVLAEESEMIEVRHIFLGDEQVENIVMTPDLSGRLARSDHRQAADDVGFTNEVLTMLESDAARQNVSMNDILKTVEARIVTQAVERADGNLSAAARALGMTRAQIAYRLSQAEGDER